MGLGISGEGASLDEQMDARLKEKIKARAFELWQQAGSPEGRESEFWIPAENELKGDPVNTNRDSHRSGSGSDGHS